ncbi:hypothetical protein C1645_833312 [Glomus cerebriforme]|uniref:Protein kinase domain-containing protein n=1 Tax=Glomus cerebriforme TaxID=658196 RepID=A0A397SFV5_9GLOM|nr:hypothetical protein C1645_833312 [Glomus cerebriforme]
MISSQYNDITRCKNCGKKYTSIRHAWCRPCQINYLKKNFTNWTSENEKIDNFIQEMQLKIKEWNDIVLEWMPYDKFIDIKEIGKDDASTIYSAIWTDSLLNYDDDKMECTREFNKKVTLKYLENSQNLIDEFLNEAKNHSIKNTSILRFGEKDILKIYGISRNPDTKDYIIILQDGYCEKCGEEYTNIKYKWCNPCLINDLKNNFSNWTSGNEKIDYFIQGKQLEFDDYCWNDVIFEWIPYSQFSDIKEISKNDFTTVYLAIWKDGPLYYYDNKKNLRRNHNRKVSLKCFGNLQNTVDEYINKAENDNEYTKLYGILKHSWTSGNEKIDNFVQVVQLKIESVFQDDEIFEWIPYDQFNNLNEIGKGDFITIYSAIWKNGPLNYDYDEEKWIRKPNMEISLKCLNNSQNMTDEFLNKIVYYLSDEDNPKIYGISQNPSTKDYIMIFQDEYCEKCCKIYTNICYKWCKPCWINDFKNNWTSGNEKIDDFIQEMQVNDEDESIYSLTMFEWIPYEKFNKVEEIGKISFTTIYSAIWNEGPLYIGRRIRKPNKRVVLKCLDNSKNAINELINKTKNYLVKGYSNTIKIYGISQNPDTRDYIIVSKIDYCEKCGRQYSFEGYCKPCQKYYLKNNFTNWTSENERIDVFIQEMQLKIEKRFRNDGIFEWIPYNQFYNLNEIGKGDFITIYSAIWKNGPLNYDYDDVKWIRKPNREVVLKSLDNSQNKINEFLNEVKNHNHKIYGLSKNANTKDYIIVLQNEYCKKCGEKYKNVRYKWCKLCWLNSTKHSWTSGNKRIDEFIQEMQLKMDSLEDIIFKWIPYNQFNNIKEIYKNGFTTIYSAIWKDGPLYYNYQKVEWIREPNKEIALKCLDNSQNMIDKFFNEVIEVKNYSIKNTSFVERFINNTNNILKIYGISQNPNTKDYIMAKIYSINPYSSNILQIYGISQNPDTKNYIMVLQDGYCEKCGEQYTNVYHKWCKSCQINNLKNNFIKWSSENKKIDDLIQEMQVTINNYNDKIFEWIPYSQFYNIKEVGKGGFATVYSAIWKDGSLYYDINEKIYIRNQNEIVALKCLDNSQNKIDEFLDEVKAYSSNPYSYNILKIYGISQNADTKDYIMVLQYAKCGNFNDWIYYNYKDFNWKCKIIVLNNISKGLKEIHQKQMVHRDFHIGNILFNNHIENSSFTYMDITTLISDMGLCGNVDNIDKTKIYGVMPYVAPEVLRGKPYTQAADIYSFGMIMYFVATGRQPFANYAHNELLALDICKGRKPEINEPEAPKCYIDLMNKCLDLNPNNRPNVNEIVELISSFINLYDIDYSKLYNEDFITIKNDEIEEQFKKAEEYRELHLPSFEKNRQYATHPQAIYTSRILNPFTENLPKYNDDNTECLDCGIIND